MSSRAVFLDKHIAKMIQDKTQQQGKGEGDNEFTMRPGVQLGIQKVKETGKGFRVGVGYQQLSNELGESTTDGHILTPFFYDFLGNIYNSYPDDKGETGGYGFHYSLGVSWDLTKLEDVDNYDTWGSMSGSAGLAYRFIWDKADLSLFCKYHRYFANDTLDKLNQDDGWTIGLLFAF